MGGLSPSRAAWGQQCSALLRTGGPRSAPGLPAGPERRRRIFRSHLTSECGSAVGPPSRAHQAPPRVENGCLRPTGTSCGTRRRSEAAAGLRPEAHLPPGSAPLAAQEERGWGGFGGCPGGLGVSAASRRRPAPAPSARTAVHLLPGRQGHVLRPRKKPDKGRLLPAAGTPGPLRFRLWGDLSGCGLHWGRGGSDLSRVVCPKGRLAGNLVPAGELRCHLGRAAVPRFPLRLQGGTHAALHCNPPTPVWAEGSAHLSALRTREAGLSLDGPQGTGHLGRSRRPGRRGGG